MPRISPTMGRSASDSSAARNSGSYCSTRPTRSSRSKPSRLASATAQLTGCPPHVMPCRKDAPGSRNGSAMWSPYHYAPEGRVARGQALGHRDHVGLVAEALAAEHGAQPPEGADHLVRHEQHAVAVADLPHPGEVAVGRREAAAGVLHRLEVHGGDRLRPLTQDGGLDLV